MTKFYTGIHFPPAPRVVSKVTSISGADAFCWKLAERAYFHATTRHQAPTERVRWQNVPVQQQDVWFWAAKAVLAAMQELEG